MAAPFDVKVVVAARVTGAGKEREEAVMEPVVIPLVVNESVPRAVETPAESKLMGPVPALRVRFCECAAVPFIAAANEIELLFVLVLMAVVVPAKVIPPAPVC